MDNKNNNTLRGRYKSPTPTKWRNLGDSLLIAVPILQGFIATSSLEGTTKELVSFGIVTLLIAGKILTNLFVENPK